MRTTLRFVGVVLGGLMALEALHVNAQETLQQDAKPITASYESGAVEHYVVRWTGLREVNHREDGHPSEPLKGWFTDTRQCRWEIDSRIVRRAYLRKRRFLAALFDGLQGFKLDLR
jgi:hypothetical protein